jgi:hypothetical protein
LLSSAVQEFVAPTNATITNTDKNCLTMTSDFMIFPSVLSIDVPPAYCLQAAYKLLIDEHLFWH